MAQTVERHALRKAELVNGDALDDSSRARYASDGFLAVRGVLAGDALDRLVRDVTQLFDRPVEDELLMDRPVIVCWRHRPDGKRSIFALSDSCIVEGLATGGRLHDMCRALAGTDYLQLFECVVFDKPPEIGEQFVWHNDQSYYPTEPGHSISIWIALDECDEENGALCFAKGSHRHGEVASVEVKTGKPMVARIHDVDLPDPEQAGYETELLIMRPGDGVFFDAHTWHASPPNRSPTRRRRGICFRYWTEPTRYAPAPGKQAMFMRQIGNAPGETIIGPCFPVFKYPST